jgi:hypothetical protein
VSAPVSASIGVAVHDPRTSAPAARSARRLRSTSESAAQTTSTSRSRAPDAAAPRPPPASAPVCAPLA